MLRLFAESLLHPCDELGRPSMDWGLLVEGLVKLDAGAPEKTLLATSDGSSAVVVSYADLQRCLAGAYADLYLSEGRE